MKLQLLHPAFARPGGTLTDPTEELTAACSNLGAARPRGEGFLLFAPLSRFLHWGQRQATWAHVENEDGICCEDSTATYSTSGAAQLVRWGIHVICTVIKILTLGARPGNMQHEDGTWICCKELTSRWAWDSFLHWGQGLDTFTHCSGWSPEEAELGINLRKGRLGVENGGMV